MNDKRNILEEFHWLMDVLQSVDVGLVVLNRDFKIELWNSFMQNHSALTPTEAMGNSIFELFSELPEAWFKRKVKSVFALRNSAFTTWEQRPYLFRFKNYRPITGTAPYMYQNCTVVPLIGTNCEVNNICLIVYDVTDTAVNKQGMQVAHEKLEQLSRTDRLTELYNRGYWEECLQQEYRRFKRQPGDTCLIMFDIDHFKKVNDTHGHPAGDEVIRRTAKILRSSIREIDIAGRYGGEEFAVILINCEKDGAGIFAERLRKSIEAYTVKHDDIEISYTVSLGVAQLSKNIDSPESWITAADSALYEAKNTGRNCWKVAPS